MEEEVAETLSLQTILKSILASIFGLTLILAFWRIFWKFVLYKFPFIQAIVSGEAQAPTIPEVQLTEEEARREREIRIAKKRKTRKAE
ncbi:Oidioi.mRNA.OKI2018_I69.chr2.g3991.t1.cds [Oikopleura dioica]|uniref:Oidioi.mRNA.OKI2018_I69.chr2.g3991.t1.cds n=1 Tax=Oikopleura dioica TaxID=34765 RepID=A0ABN7T2M1_OIKDI|nr:Oidioi.mRNA.OKI2018_I69.chr2.g3991.t1.cds [Oikopleura dioica]